VIFGADDAYLNPDLAHASAASESPTNATFSGVFQGAAGRDV